MNRREFSAQEWMVSSDEEVAQAIRDFFVARGQSFGFFQLGKKYFHLIYGFFRNFIN